jgi:hypothetical protein
MAPLIGERFGRRQLRAHAIAVKTVEVLARLIEQRLFGIFWLGTAENR